MQTVHDRVSMNATAYSSRFAQVLSVAILFACLVSCSGRRMLPRPHGSKVAPAATYLSAKEVAERGKNQHGVPEASYFFYPEDFVPGEKSLTGRTPEESEALREMARREGRQINCHGFVPAGTPSWDNSFCDPPTIRHDCFTMERLFVVPWGSGESEVGKVAGTVQLVEPDFMIDAKGQIQLLDHAAKRIKVFSQQGSLVESRVVDYANDPIFPYQSRNRDLPADALPWFDYLDRTLLHSGLVMGISYYYHEKSDNPWHIGLGELRSEKVVCKVYGPPVSDPRIATTYNQKTSYNRPRVLLDGSVISARVTAAGFEVFLYRLGSR